MARTANCVGSMNIGASSARFGRSVSTFFLSKSSRIFTLTQMDCLREREAAHSKGIISRNGLQKPLFWALIGINY